MDEAGEAAEAQAGVGDDRAPGGQAAAGEADSETAAKADAADLEAGQQPAPDAATQQQVSPNRNTLHELGRFSSFNDLFQCPPRMRYVETEQLTRACSATVVWS